MAKSELFCSLENLGYADSESPRNTALRLYLTVVQHAEKVNAQTGTFGFYRPQSKRKKPKEPFFADILTD